jgi:hypothetical protein
MNFAAIRLHALGMRAVAADRRRPALRNTALLRCSIAIDFSISMTILSLDF